MVNARLHMDRQYNKSVKELIIERKGRKTQVKKGRKEREKDKGKNGFLIIEYINSSK